MEPRVFDFHDGVRLEILETGEIVLPWRPYSTSPFFERVRIEKYVAEIRINRYARIFFSGKKEKLEEFIFSEEALYKGNIKIFNMVIGEKLELRIDEISIIFQSLKVINNITIIKTVRSNFHRLKKNLENNIL